MAVESSHRKQEHFLGSFTEGVTPEAAEVLVEVERIRNSNAFVRSARIQRLLEYLVKSVLKGQQERLKESVIGVDVFDRPVDYDPKLDPIVRVEMRRIRSKLSEYYLSEGQSDEVLVWLEKGSYVPLLLKRMRTEPEATSVEANETLSAAAAVGAVSSAGTVLETVPPSAKTTESYSPLPTHQSRRVLYTAIGVVLGAMLSAAIAFFHSDQATTPARSLRLFPLTGNAGVEISPAFSPDGKQVAYSWDGNRRNLDIYIKPVEGGSLRRLTDNAAHDLHPVWSPDGEQIAFLRVFPDRSQIVIIPATSGVEKVIAELVPPAAHWHPAGPGGNEANGPVWSRDGSFLVSTAFLPDRSAVGLVKIFTNGRQELLTRPAAGFVDSGPCISPREEIAFVRTWGSSSADIYLLSAGKLTRITFDSRDVQGLAWLDADHLVFSSNRGGAFRLWQVQRTGGTPAPFAAGGARPQWPAISPDGHWLAFVEASDDTAIWRSVLNKEGVAGEAEPFISSAASDNSPAYSPDGRRIVYVSDRTGKRQLWICDGDGSNVRQLTDFRGATVGTPRWSPDNHRIVFDASMNGQTGIWLVDDDGNNLHRLNSSTTREYLPSWSRDGEWVYYVSLQNGTDELWKQRPTSGEKVRVSGQTFFDAVESPLGDAIYAERLSDSIWKIPDSGGLPEKVNELSGTHPARYWTLVGDNLYFLRDEQAPRELDVLNFKTLQVRKVTNIAGPVLPGTPGLAVDPAQHFLLAVQKNLRRSSIMLQER